MVLYPSNPLTSSSHWLLSAKSIIIQNSAGVFNAELQNEPVFLNGNGKSAIFKIYVRSQATGELVDTIDGAFQISLTPTGTSDKEGNLEYLLNFATTWAGSSQLPIVCPGGRFQGINERSGTPYGIPFANIRPGLLVPGSKADADVSGFVPGFAGETNTIVVGLMAKPTNCARTPCNLQNE